MGSGIWAGELHDIPVVLITVVWTALQFHLRRVSRRGQWHSLIFLWIKQTNTRAPDLDSIFPAEIGKQHIGWSGAFDEKSALRLRSLLARARVLQSLACLENSRRMERGSPEFVPASVMASKPKAG